MERKETQPVIVKLTDKQFTDLITVVRLESQIEKKKVEKKGVK